MQLNNLYLKNFKSYEEAEIDFCPRVNCIVGNNGSGKTNLLDAVHYLSVSKSYFAVADRDNIRHGEEFFSINGRYTLDGNDAQVSVIQRKGQRKTLKFNQKDCPRMSEHIGRIPLIMVSPQDQELIYGGSELRRKFLDNVISQFNRPYLEHLLAYTKAVEQRNRLLKEENPDPSLLEVFDLQMQQHGEPIYEERKRFVADFIPVFRNYYNLIAGSGEQADLEYHSQLNGCSFADLLRQALPKDRILQFSTVGVHKDDMDLLLDGHPIKKCGSQGQQKSFLLALRLSQLQYTAQVKKRYPILLLDDIFDKLDLERVRRLMNIVGKEHFGQVFLSDTHPERVLDLFGKDSGETRVFKVENSRIKEVK